MIKVRCEMCNITCKKETSLKKHIKNKHKTINARVKNYHKCEICNIKCKTKIKLKRHIKSEHNLNVDP